jgi:C-terminal processing protease CtpA/Prc
MKELRRLSASILLMVFVLVPQGSSGQISDLDRSRAKQMLKQIISEIGKDYFDQTFGGRDLAAIEAAVGERIEKAASLGQALGLIAQTLIDFNDSHLRFAPPSRTVSVEYDWQVAMIGEDAFIVAVRPGSDAARQGLAPGDRVYAIDGFVPRRSQMWKQLYNYRWLNPRPEVTLRVQPPNGPGREVVVKSTIKQGQRVMDLQLYIEQIQRDYDNESIVSRHLKQTLGGRVVVWKVPDFEFEAEDTLKWALAGAQDLILDLRGNPGGAVDTLSQVVGRLFDREITIAERQGREPMKPMVSKKNGQPFKGRIVALIDSRSASAAEVLARVLQLERRGVVVGDRSAGAVRQSGFFLGKIGGDRVVVFGASITNADVIMTDGKTLEHTGVIPDELLLPTPTDLAAGRDPVLSRAAAILGVDLDPAAAGRLFPVVWR